MFTQLAEPAEPEEPGGHVPLQIVAPSEGKPFPSNFFVPPDIWTFRRPRLLTALTLFLVARRD